jgi:hypothetical protein
VPYHRTLGRIIPLLPEVRTSNWLPVVSAYVGHRSECCATRLCEAKFGTLYFREKDDFRAAMHGAPPAYLKERLHSLFQPILTTALGRVVRTQQVVHIEDVTTERAYSKRDPMRVSLPASGDLKNTKWVLKK